VRFIVMQFERLPESVQTVYAELLDKEIRGARYWYVQKLGLCNANRAGAGTETSTPPAPITTAGITSSRR
jgi:hypothetical protein